MSSREDGRLTKARRSRIAVVAADSEKYDMGMESNDEKEIAEEHDEDKEENNISIIDQPGVHFNGTAPDNNNQLSAQSYNGAGVETREFSLRRTRNRQSFGSERIKSRPTEKFGRE